MCTSDAKTKRRITSNEIIPIVAVVVVLAVVVLVVVLVLVVVVVCVFVWCEGGVCGGW